MGPCARPLPILTATAAADSMTGWSPAKRAGTGAGPYWQPGFPFWPSWSVYDSRLPAAMQRFSHCCQVRYSFRCRSGLRMLADHGVPAKPEGPLATPLPRRPSVTRVRWLFRAVDVTLRAQVAPKSAAACRRTTSGSDAPPHQDFLFGRPGAYTIADYRLRCNGFRTAARFGTPFAAAPAFACWPIMAFQRSQRAL